MTLFNFFDLQHVAYFINHASYSRAVVMHYRLLEPFEAQGFDYPTLALIIAD